jgi:three-Cys-motif partner protein
MSTQDFGGVWTVSKLKVIEDYLAFYTQALKAQGFKLCYIDAFAGRGEVRIKSGEILDGSVIRSLKYDFDAFRFFEKDSDYYNALQESIHDKFPEKEAGVKIYNSDCNKFLQESINTYDWKSNHWRGVIFLDPYAMQLEWNSLEKIQKTEIFDVWYLFPFSAVNRNLYKNKLIPENNKNALSKILGTTEWEYDIYNESPQESFFDCTEWEKTDTEGVKKYILKRLHSVFPTVSDKATLLKNEKKSPMFLLCFAGSNPNSKAQKLSLKVADHILSKL